MTLIDVVLPCLMGLSYIVYFKVYHVCFGSDTQDQSTLKLFCTDVIASCVVGFVFALTMVVGLNEKEQEIKEQLDACSTCDMNCVANNGLSDASMAQLKNKTGEEIVDEDVKRQMEK